MHEISFSRIFSVCLPMISFLPINLMFRTGLWELKLCQFLSVSLELGFTPVILWIGGGGKKGVYNKRSLNNWMLSRVINDHTRNAGGNIAKKKNRYINIICKHALAGYVFFLFDDHYLHYPHKSSMNVFYCIYLSYF